MKYKCTAVTVSVYVLNYDSKCLSVSILKVWTSSVSRSLSSHTQLLTIVTNLCILTHCNVVLNNYVVLFRRHQELGLIYSIAFHGALAYIKTNERINTTIGIVDYVNAR